MDDSSALFSFQRFYKNELKLNICGSSNDLKLQLSGQGLEARLEFSPPALKMGRVLVGSHGVEATVVVKNPCTFPIEFYCLDFDEQYLEEEKVRRQVWSPWTRCPSFTALQHCQACAREMEAIPRARPALLTRCGKTSIVGVVGREGEDRNGVC